MFDKPKRLSEIDFKPVGKVFPSPAEWNGWIQGVRCRSENFDIEA